MFVVWVVEVGGVVVQAAQGNILCKFALSSVSVLSFFFCFLFYFRIIYEVLQMQMSFPSTLPPLHSFRCGIGKFSARDAHLMPRPK